MPRAPRIQFEGATYHIFSRGNRRERIFRTDDDYAAFQDMMLEAMRWSGVHLFNWGQMPNHFHLNVETPDGHIAEFMQRLLSRFAMYFNRTHKLVGHLFQGRYGSRLVDTECYFKEIVRYVELNAYRTKGAPLAALGQWKWSSLRHYLLPEDQWPEGCRNAFRQVLDRFGRTPTESRKNLSQFLADGLAAGDWEDFYKVKDGRFIGSDAFVERMKQENEEPIRSKSRAIRTDLGVNGLFTLTQTLSGLPAEALAASSQARGWSRWRQAFAFVARHYYRVPAVTLGHLLKRDPTAISHMIKTVQNRAMKSTELLALEKAIERLERVPVPR